MPVTEFVPNRATKLLPFLRCSECCTCHRPHVLSKLIYARYPFNRASPTLHVEIRLFAAFLPIFRPIREYILSLGTYFSSYSQFRNSSKIEAIRFVSEKRRERFSLRHDERQKSLVFLNLGRVNFSLTDD